MKKHTQKKTELLAVLNTVEILIETFVSAAICIGILIGIGAFLLCL